MFQRSSQNASRSRVLDSCEFTSEIARHLQDASGKHAPPVRHQAVEQYVIPAGVERIARVVVKRRLLFEEMAKIAQAGIDRVTPQADQLGPWQGTRDEAGVQEIVRQLVDEMRLARRGRTGAGEISCA